MGISIALLGLALSSGCFAQIPAENPDSCEQADGLLRPLALSFIKYYQSHISVRSVQRCPFQISCSNFSARAIKDYGLYWGILRTIDRYYYRENVSVFTNYTRLVDGSGRTVLDDDYYLLGDAQWMDQEKAGLNAGIAASPLFNLDVSTELADSLFRSGSWREAEIVYRAVIMKTTDEKLKIYCSYRCSWCLFHLGEFSNAVLWAGRSLNQPSDDTGIAWRAELLLGLIYSQQRLTPLASYHFQESLSIQTNAPAKLGLAFVKMQEEDWSKSLSLIEDVRESGDVKVIRLFEDAIENARSLSLKSPFKAKLFSAILPGSGQFYSSHPVDGLQAFLFVSAFGYATWSSYRFERDKGKPMFGAAIGSIFTATFYLANVIGAGETAKYRNYRLKRDIFDPVKEALIETAVDID